MNEIASLPSMVMIVYQNEDAGIYIEIGDVVKNQVHNMRPLSKLQLKEIIKLVEPSRNIPKKVQIINRTIVAYQEAPFIVSWISEHSDINIFVGNKQIIGKALHFLFAIKDNKPYCFFIKKNRGEKTILYEANLPNMSPDQSICFGTNKINTDSIEAAIKSYEEIFYGTGFSNYSTKTISDLITFGVVKSKTLKKFCKLDEFINS